MAWSAPTKQARLGVISEASETSKKGLCLDKLEDALKAVTVCRSKRLR